MKVHNRKLEKQSEQLYECYGKPLENKYWGKYVAISPKGKTILAPTFTKVAQKALGTLGRGSFIFKVGDRVVGKWR